MSCSASRFVIVACLLAGALARPSAAYETDQYSLRDEQLADSVDQLNERVNVALGEIAADWRGAPDPSLFARAVYKRLGGRHWVDHLERWAIRRSEIDKRDEGKRQSIYGDLPFWATRINFLFGVGPTIRVAGVLIGTDKLGHFLSQGWKYHKRYLRGLPIEKTVRLGVRNEAFIFGGPFTGVFSNADLVADYEGLLFYRSLFEDNVVEDRRAIIEWTAGGARLARQFDFRDHVNDFWDEALNPNRFDRLLDGPMRQRLMSLCPSYQEDPSAWVSPDDAELREHYAHLGIRDGTSHRLDQLCTHAGVRAALSGSLQPPPEGVVAGDDAVKTSGAGSQREVHR